MRSPALTMSRHIYRKFPRFLWKVYKLFETKKCHKTLQNQGVDKVLMCVTNSGFEGMVGLQKHYSRDNINLYQGSAFPTLARVSRQMEGSVLSARSAGRFTGLKQMGENLLLPCIFCRQPL